MSLPGGVLVTGGAGFVGSHVAERFMRAGHSVKVLDVLSRGRREWVPQGADLHVEDIRDREAVERVVAAARPIVVVHLAAMHFIPAVDEAPEAAWNINVDGTSALLAALDTANIERLVFASTAAVYPNLDGPLSEAVPPAPLDLYGRTKLEGERLIEGFCAETGVSCVAARLFNVIGPRETNPHVLPEIVAQLRDGSDGLRLGSLEPRRDFVDVRDVADALVRLAGSCEPGYTVFNVGSGRSFSVAEIVATCERLLGRSIPVHTDQDRLRKLDRPVLLADASALERAFSWKAERHLDASLADLLEVSGTSSS